MSFRRYESYRDSGTGWIGQLPAHWQTRRLRTLVEIKKRIAGVEGADVLSITQRGLKVRDLDTNDGQLAESYAQYQRVEVGDFAMNHMDLLTGWVDLSEHTGVTSPDYRVFSLRSRLAADPRYLLRVLQNAYSQRVFYAFGQGASHLGRWRLPTDAFQDFEVPLPPLEEQRAIVAFIDRETAKIDALVEEQRRLIELLKEKRQGVISHAVTKGLNQAAPMKDSGVVWLGEVPEHWDVKRLRFICDIETGDGDTADSVEDGEYPFFVRSPIIEKINRYTHDREAVLTAGDGAGVGKIYHHFEGKFCAHQRVYIFSNFREFSGRLLYHYMQANFAKVALEGGAKSTVDSLRRPLIANFAVAIPPLAEQQEIVGFVSEVADRTGRLVMEAKQAVELLLERRRALISAAITGKIDVRTTDRPAAVNRSRLRMVVGAAVIEALANKPNFGRTKAHKIVYLIEAHARVHELEGAYLREAAGPFDTALQDEIEKKLQAAGHLRIEQLGGPGNQVIYHLRGRRGAFRSELDVALGSRAKVLDQLIVDLGGFNTKYVEAVATLYAVWNDALLDGEDPSDDAIVAAFLNDWHPEKRQKFRAHELHTWLGWMRRHDLVPRGQGPKTSTGRLFV